MLLPPRLVLALLVKPRRMCEDYSSRFVCVCHASGYIPDLYVQSEAEGDKGL